MLRDGAQYAEGGLQSDCVWHYTIADSQSMGLSTVGQKLQQAKDADARGRPFKLLVVSDGSPTP